MTLKFFRINGFKKLITRIRVKSETSLTRLIKLLEKLIRDKSYNTIKHVLKIFNPTTTTSRKYWLIKTYPYYLIIIIVFTVITLSSVDNASTLRYKFVLSI